jgi:co-chaperonin GroES (HSP10)
MKIFGERLLLREIPEEEKMQGGILVPANSSKAYVVCEVVGIGNGKLSKSQADCPPDIAVGDSIFAQVGPQLAKSCGYMVDGKRHFAMHWGDALAVVTSSPPTPDTFRPVGRWVLLDVEIEDTVGGIYLPNQTAQSAAAKVTFRVFKLGALAKAQLGVEPGTAVYIDKMRANIFSLQKRRLAYVDCDYVTGEV